MAAALAGLLLSLAAFAQAPVAPQAEQEVEQEVGQEVAQEIGDYLINAGDILQLQVWNEPTLSAEQVLVRPDGFISVPVVGEIKAGQRSVDQIRKAVVTGLNRYLKDEPTVVISVLNTAGSQVYVLGKVLRSGAYPLHGPLDVTQALAMAGGLNSFAAENKIKVLRRNAQGIQQAIEFRYGEVRGGEKLASNILLISGDVVLVP
jgi:polysaccharide export outer membrane protein